MVCIEQFMVDCPRELQLDKVGLEAPGSGPPPDFFAPASALVSPGNSSGLHFPAASNICSTHHTFAKSSFQAQQANLYVTLVSRQCAASPDHRSGCQAGC
jgi:hypothetical protein